MATESEMLEAVDLLQEKYCASAIILRPPYPPINMPRVRSQLGGLPLLPEAISWPWGRLDDEKTPTPLHFLAQIDCAELPHIDSRMPGKGILFFFGRNDDQMAWANTNPLEISRVIYVPNVPEIQIERQHPPELNQLRGEPPHGRLSYANSGPWNPYDMLPGETGPSVYPRWPLVARRFSDWPSFNAISGTTFYKEVTAKLNLSTTEKTAFYNLYRDRIRARYALAAKESPTPINLTLLPSLWWWTEEFPQVGIMIDRFARRIVLDATKEIDLMQRVSAKIRGGAVGYKAPNPEEEAALQRTIPQAHHWIARATEIGWDAVPSEEDRGKFKDWLTEIKEIRKLHVWNEAFQSCITYAGGSPIAAALIPQRYYDAYEGWQRNWASHQMLGYFPHSYNERAVDDATVRLFYGPEPDGGHLDGRISFFIEPDDLINRRFEKAYAIIDHD